MKFKFHETFTVDFVVEAETYEKSSRNVQQDV